MNSPYIPNKVRERVYEEAHYRCGYCLTSQTVVGPFLEIDHLIPQSQGGTSDIKNLWVACPKCNGAKSDRTEGTDPISGDLVPLFNPRHDIWVDHFGWSVEGTLIEGKSAIGRATIDTLNMNRPEIIVARELWVEAGWHPPTD
jgi:hypothetical protein